MDYSKPFPCGECGKMVMATEKHTFEDCEKWKNGFLLPCPFCGSKAEETFYLEKNVHIVICTNEKCRVETKVCETKEQAMNIWNRRAKVN